MESQAKYAVIGSFVFVAAVLLVVALLWLSEAGGSRNVAYYKVHFRKHSLDGLQKDGDVTMKGIKVGSVDDYYISPRSVEEVVTRLKLDEKTPIKVDTRAVIRRNILTGIAYIDLVGSSERSGLLREVHQGTQDPVIPEGTSELDKIAETIPAMVEQLNSISGRITTLLSTENVDSIRSTLKNLEKLSFALGENAEKIENIITNLESTSEHINATSKAVRSFAQNSDKAVAGLGDQSSKTLREVEVLVKNLDKRTQKVAESFVGASQVFSQEMTSVSQGISEASQALARTVEGFEDPRTIITGPRSTSLGPGEKLKE
jgi:phospholipid/cholesterol/gamma-HCH transport system substrate-binding protein